MFLHMMLWPLCHWCIGPMLFSVIHPSILMCLTLTLRNQTGILLQVVNQLKVFMAEKFLQFWRYNPTAGTFLGWNNSPIHTAVCMRGSCTNSPLPPLCEVSDVARSKISLRRWSTSGYSIRAILLAIRTSVNRSSVELGFVDCTVQ